MKDRPTPIFSVVIPVYNKGPHIRRAVSSVLNQTLQDFELILIDDASTDNSLQEINRFDDPRMRLFHRKTPGPGGYAARNLGIAKARGQWITFLDADDEWLPSYLENIRDLSQEFPDCSLLSCGWRSVGPMSAERTNTYFQGNAARGPHAISLLEYLTLSVQSKRPIHTNVVCIRNDEIASNLFPDGRACRGGDLYAWISYLVRSKQMAWSPTLGAVRYLNSVNMVTKSAPYSIDLLSGFIEDFRPFVNRAEMRMLKKIVNRKVFEGWLWHKLKNEAPFSLSSNLHWYGDTSFCLTRSALSLLPSSALHELLRIKALVRSLLSFRRIK